MRPIWRDHPVRVRLMALALAAALVALLSTLASNPLRATEERVADLAWRVGASAAAERRLVVIDIDEASLRQEGPWPWPRATLMRLSERLRDAGAAAQVFDMVFPEPKPGDEALAALWAKTPVVLGQIFSLDPAVSPAVGQAAGPLATTDAAAQCPPGVAVSHGVIGNAPALLEARPATGHLTPRIERDGVVRKVPALVCHEGRLYPSLALAALSRLVAGQAAGTASAPDWRLIVHSASPRQAQPAFPGLLLPSAWLSAASLPGVVVPLDDRGDMRVPYRMQRRAMVSISAAEVLSGSADLSMLRGTLALVGATAFGIGDAVATPLDPVAAGVEVHAQAIAGLLDNRVPYAPRASSALQALAMLAVAALLLAVASRRRSPAIKSLPLAGLVLAALTVAAGAWLLLRVDLWLPWAEVALFALVGATALAAAEHALTRAQRERLSAHLGAYLPAPVAQRLAASDPTGSLDVVRRDISVMVTDVRNFAAFAMHRPPEETAAVLHAYCSAAVEVVERHGGVVENVTGGSIVAVWNAYGDCDDHAPRALRAGHDLLTATRELFAPRRWLPEASVIQPLALGIGLEAGPAIVGSFGPARRRAHAALGEPVTVAVRLQSMTQDLSVPILVGPRMAALLPAAATAAQGEYLLEGLSRHCELFAPAAWTDWVPAETVWPQGATRSDDADGIFDTRTGIEGTALGQRRLLGDA